MDFSMVQSQKNYIGFFEILNDRMDRSVYFDLFFSWRYGQVTE